MMTDPPEPATMSRTQVAPIKHRAQVAKGSRATAKSGAIPNHGEETPAYQVLAQHGLLDASYRIETAEEIDALPENATRLGNCLLSCFCCPLKCFFSTFEVNAATLKLVEDGRGSFMFYGEGVHRICDPFYTVGNTVKYNKGAVVHGDRTLVVVQQGQIGYCQDQGHPILLPPGLHQWRSPTMVFEKVFDLNNNVVRMGPLTLVTVDSGYSAVTEDNGMQKILVGGNTYLLTHRNWKFQKYIPQKIQSSNLNRIEATSADNVLMAVDATVIWRITDVETAALNSAETISKTGQDQDGHDLGSLAKLTNDVLKQAEASLAAFIGAVEYSSTFAVATSATSAVGGAAKVPIGVQLDDVAAGVTETSGSRGDDEGGDKPAARKARLTSPLFDLERLRTCVDHANDITKTYGVTITSINVVAAVPADKTLMVSLAQGAVAAAEAQKFETVAAGKAEAIKHEARGEADAEVFRARGDAEAAKMRAKGHKAAADLLEQNKLAVQLAQIDHTGSALGENKAFFFGADSKDLGSLLAANLTSRV